jgi:hypothetical protein
VRNARLQCLVPSGVAASDGAWYPAKITGLFRVRNFCFSINSCRPRRLAEIRMVLQARLS